MPKNKTENKKSDAGLKPSPYVLDLKKTIQEREAYKETFEYRSKNFISQLTVSLTAFFDSLRSFKLSKRKQPRRLEEVQKPAYLKNLEMLEDLTAGQDLSLDKLIRQAAVKDDSDSFEQPPVSQINFAKAASVKTQPVKKSIQTPKINIKLPDKHKKVFNFLITSAVIASILIIFVFTTNLVNEKNKVLGATSNALEELKVAKAASYDFDLDLAGAKFDQARKNFIIAQHELDNLNFLAGGLVKILPNKEIKSGRILIEAGENLSLAASHLSRGVGRLLASADESSFTEKIIKMRNEFSIAAPLLAQAAGSLAAVDLKAIPEASQSDFNNLKAGLPVVSQVIDRFIAESEALLGILGHYQKKRYLIVFQNNTEIRPTGGFMGSYALVDVKQGKIVNLEIPGGGFYDLQGSLRVKAVSPEPFHLINPVWEPQDANWFFDFPTSAEKIIWFYYKAGGPTVDGLITLNTFVLKDILAMTGPVDMPQYGRTITADNFIEEIQTVVEFEYDRQLNRPKQIIADLAPVLIERLFEFQESQYLGLTDILAKNLAEKDLLLYFTDDQTEKLVRDLDWAGQVKETGKDYLAVVNTNIAGGKTDGVIRQKISHQAEIMPDGSLIDTVRVARTHLGNKANIFTGVNNVDFIRIYTPLGSTLLSADGFSPPPAEYFEDPPEGYYYDQDLSAIESQKLVDPLTQTVITTENNKTVFGNWVQVDVGQTAEAVFKYRLPFKIKFSENKPAGLTDKLKSFLGLTNQEMVYYSLLIQKQPGDWQTDFNSQLTAPADWRLEWSYPESFDQTILNTDKFYGKVFTNKL